MSLTVAIVLGVLALAFYGVVFWAIGWQMGRNATEISDAVVNRAATPVEQFPTMAQWVERNHIKRTVLR